MKNREDIGIADIIAGYWIIGHGWLKATYHVPSRWERFKRMFWEDGAAWISREELKKQNEKEEQKRKTKWI